MFHGGNVSRRTVVGAAVFAVVCLISTVGVMVVLAATGSTALVVYDGKVAKGFTENVFGASAHNACDRSQAASPPCSYSVGLDAWGGVGFTRTWSLVDLSPYTTV